MKRITFLKTSGKMVVGLTCGSSLLSGCKAFSGISETPEAPPGSYSMKGNMLVVNLDKTPVLNSPGGSVKYNIPENELKIIIARISDQEFVIMDDRCTHGGRELEYHHDKKMFRCVSFSHSRYDLSGEKIKGPAPNDIRQYTASLNEEILSIDLS